MGSAQHYRESSSRQPYAPLASSRRSIASATPASKAIVLACDDHYAPHALVVLRSLPSSTPIHDLQQLLLSSLSPVWEERLHALVGASGAILETVPLRQFLEQPPVRQLASQLDQSSVPHTSAAALARLQAGQLLPSHCRRALYLDCDLVVQADLSALLEHPLAGQPLAAVPDALITRMGHQRLRFPTAHTYVNSGVLLIDLDHWRRLDLDAAAMAIAASQRLRGQLLYPDQDVINLIALQHGCQRLSSRWNHQLIHGAHASVHSEQDASETPAILHFAGEVKPWKSWYPSGAAKEAYWHWRQQANQCLGGVMAHEPDSPASHRDHWVAFHLWHRQGHYAEASHSAAALLQSLPAPPP